MQPWYYKNDSLIKTTMMKIYVEKALNFVPVVELDGLLTDPTVERYPDVGALGLGVLLLPWSYEDSVNAGK